MGRHRTVFAAAAALSACVFAAAGVQAGSSPEESGFHEGAGCLSSKWVSYSDATCLDIDYVQDSNAFTTALAAIGETAFYASSACSDWGEVVAHVPRSGGGAHIHLVDANRVPHSLDRSMGKVACCLDMSDLCYKQQVEASEGAAQILLYTGTRMETHTVASHRQRYDFCQEHSSSIYCEQNPSGDAFVEPPEEGPEESLDDCYVSFPDSPAVSSCTDFSATVLYAYDADLARDMVELPDGMCHDIEVSCTLAGGQTVEVAVEGGTLLADIKSLRFCEWSEAEETKVALTTDNACPASNVQ